MPIDAGTIYSEVRIQLDKLSGDIKKVDTKFDQLASNNATQAKTVEKNWKSSFNALSLAGVAAFVAISAAVNDSIKTFASFEQSIANVKSVAGGTEEEFQKIEDAARSAGETTRFTASQAADALYSLASAGLDANESVAALDGVLKLAGATQSDLASTSAAVVSTLAQYNLEAEESARVSNVFAAAIGNSQANMEKLTNAFRQVGPVAGALNISLEETTGAIQALLDAGFQGEQAGTALRNILSSLANEADPTTRKLTELGLSFEKLDPTVNGIIDVIGTLNDANLEASQVLDAFGTRAGPQILSLLNVGKKGLEEYTAAVTDTNKAAEAYATQNDTLQGSFDSLGSAVESLKIGLISEFAPAIRLIVDAVKGFVNFLNGIPGPVKIILGLFIAGVPAVFGIVSAITALSAAAATLGVSLGAVLGPIAAVVGGVALLTGGIVALSGAIKKAEIDDIDKRFGKLSKELEISNEQMIKLVGSVESLGANSDNAVSIVIKKLKEFQKETGISDDKLNSLIKTAQKLGATDSNIADVVRKVNDLTKEFGATEDQIKEISRVFNLGGQTSETYQNMELVNKQVTLLRKNTGLSEKAILKIGLASEKVSDTYREQLDIAEKSSRLRSQLITTETQKALYIAKLEKETEQRRAAAAEAEKKRLEELENARLKAIARSKGVVEAGVKAQETYNEALRINALLEKENLITREESVKKQISSTEQLIESLFEIGYTADLTEQTYFDATGKRVTKVQEGNKILRDLIDNILPGLKTQLKEAEKAGSDTFEVQNQAAEEYRRKLEELNATNIERIEIERRAAINAVISAKLEKDAHNEAIEALNKYYDTLVKVEEEKEKDSENTVKWSEEQKEFLNELKDTADVVIDAFSRIFGAINELSAASAQRRIDDLDAVLQKNLESIDAELQKVIEAEGLKEETRAEALQREIEEAKIAGDEKTALDKSNELRRLQLTEEAEKKKADIVAENERKKAKIQYDAAISQWTINLALAVADAARAIITGYAQLGPIGGSVAAGVTAAVTGIQIAAMAQAMPQPPEFKTGGFVFPTRGYQTGGIVVPSGAGGRQITVAENGSPEMMLNSGGEGAAMMDLFASRIAAKINGAGGGVLHATFIMNGKAVAEGSAKYYNNGQVRINLS